MRRRPAQAKPLLAPTAAAQVQGQRIGAWMRASAHSIARPCSRHARKAARTLAPALAALATPFLLRIENGAPALLGAKPVTAATVTLNGLEVAGFNQNVTLIERTVTLSGGANTLAVRLAGRPRQRRFAVGILKSFQTTESIAQMMRNLCFCTHRVFDYLRMTILNSTTSGYLRTNLPWVQRVKPPSALHGIFACSRVEKRR